VIVAFSLGLALSKTKGEQVVIVNTAIEYYQVVRVSYNSPADRTTITYRDANLEEVVLQFNGDNCSIGCSYVKITNEVVIEFVGEKELKTK